MGVPPVRTAASALSVKVSAACVIRLPYCVLVLKMAEQGPRVPFFGDGGRRTDVHLRRQLRTVLTITSPLFPAGISKFAMATLLSLKM